MNQFLERQIKRYPWKLKAWLRENVTADRDWSIRTNKGSIQANVFQRKDGTHIVDEFFSLSDLAEPEPQRPKLKTTVAQLKRLVDAFHESNPDALIKAQVDDYNFMVFVKEPNESEDAEPIQEGS